MYISSRVGTLLENTRLENTRRFLEGRVLARKYSNFTFSPRTRLVLEGQVRVMPEYTRSIYFFDPDETQMVGDLRHIFNIN